MREGRNEKNIYEEGMQIKGKRKKGGRLCGKKKILDGGRREKKREKKLMR